MGEPEEWDDWDEPESSSEEFIDVSIDEESEFSDDEFEEDDSGDHEDLENDPVQTELAAISGAPVKRKPFEMRDPTRKKRPPRRWTSWEDIRLEEMWQTNTDKKIAEVLNRPEEAIYKRRRQLGFSKPNGRPKESTKKEAIFTNPTEYNLSRLSKDDRLNFYKTKFTSNPRYPWLVKTLMAEEIEYYKHKYIEMIDNLESISLQEEDLLHNMIMKEIQIMRIQTQIKDQMENFNGGNDEDGNNIPPPLYLYKDLDVAETQYVKYQEKLKLTREQRLKTDKEEKITIVSMVQSFLDGVNRRKAGDMAGQMAYSLEQCRGDMNKSQFLLGGEK